MRAPEYLRALWPAGSAAVGIAVVVLALRAVIPNTWSGWLQLSIEVLAEATAYVAVLLVAHRARMARVTAHVLDLWRARRPGPTPVA